MIKEYRKAIIPLTTRGESEGLILSGYAAVFESVTDLGYFREKIAKGAFTRCLSESPDIRALVNHDPALVIGRSKAETLSVREDEKGLAVEIKVSDTSYGRDLMESVKRGDIDGMSFGFTVTPQGQRWEAQKGESTELRTLLDVELIEVSAVTFPAYEATSITGRSIRNIADERAGFPVSVFQKKLDTFSRLL